ncbi:MAG: hypothetical protein KAT26_03650 [Marinosulfonomonas sp.]|nr:hypothetical protein [Marinosulfonomonas sp.]
MGLFDFFTGTKRPKSGVPVATAAEIKAAILAVNRDTAPFQIMPCDDGSCDIIAERKIVDAQWYQIFAKAGLKKTFRIKMHLDHDKSEVRAVDEDFTVSWSAGIPTLKLAASGFRGQKTEMSFGTAYAFTEEFKPGQVYQYRFNSSELKKPLQQAVTDKGWTWRGVSFGKL